MDNKISKLLFLFTNLICYEMPEDGSGARSGGSGEIRTHEGLAPLPVFKTGAFNRSATLPHDHYPLFHESSPSKNNKIYLIYLKYLYTRTIKLCGY